MRCKLCSQRSSGRGLICPDCWYKPFEITSVYRADLQDKFSEKEIAKFDDTKMAYMARKMADAYCENVFWIDLEIITQYILSELR